MKSSASEPGLKCSLAGTDCCFKLKERSSAPEGWEARKGYLFQVQEYAGVGVSLIEVLKRVSKSANPVGKN